MASLVSGFPAKSIASGVAAAVLVGVTAYGLVQIGTVFQRAISYLTPNSIKENKTLLAWQASISDKLGTLFVSTDARNETYKENVAAKDAAGKEVKNTKGEVEFAAKKGEYTISGTRLILSGVALCIVALAGFKLMSYWSAGESPLNKVITYYSGLQVAPSESYTVFNSLSDLKSKFI